MKIISLEPTNLCNRSCRHCFRNLADPPGFLPLETAGAILAQAKLLGFQVVCLTGGEVALYPHLGDLLRLIAAQGFNFNLVTNGLRFREQVLPLLLEPEVREQVTSVCFSLDGARTQTHEALRGPKSFREVMEGLTSCGSHGLPVSLKTVVTALNQDELTELALLGARMGVFEHAFLYPLPTPRLIREGLLPPREKLNDAAAFITNQLAGAIRSRITVEGYYLDGVNLNCGHLVDVLNVDYQGNLIFCCNLSHVTMGDGVATPPGREFVADLKKVPLKEGIVRQVRQAAALLEARLNDDANPWGLSENPCHWCLKHFGKFDWLRDFPDSPWADWLMAESRPPSRLLKTGSQPTR